MCISAVRAPIICDLHFICSLCRSCFCKCAGGELTICPLHKALVCTLTTWVSARPWACLPGFTCIGHNSLSRCARLAQICYEKRLFLCWPMALTQTSRYSCLDFVYCLTDCLSYSCRRRVLRYKHRIGNLPICKRMMYCKQFKPYHPCDKRSNSRFGAVCCFGLYV